MLIREHKPENIKRNEEESKYEDALKNINIDSISDEKTKFAIENLLAMIKSLKVTTKKIW